MDERRHGVEWPEQQSQHRQLFVKKNKSDIKQEKRMSKTESRFKSKLESLKKFQHSASTNSAVEKARAFFRSLELKHIGGSSSSDHSSSSSRRRTTTTTATNNKNNNNNASLLSSSTFPLPSSISSSSSSSIIDDTHNTISTTTTNDSSFKSKNPANGIAKARIIRVINPNYINPKDTIVHRMLHNEHDNHQFASSYFYSPQILPQKNIQPSKQYYNERNQNYLTSFEKHREMQAKYDSRPLSPECALNANIRHSNDIYPNYPSFIHSNINNGNILNNPLSTSLYNYRPLVCRQMEPSSLMSSSFHEQSHSLFDPIIRPLPSSASSSSMSIWTQSVRRLNTEYTSTINALQQAKESLKQFYPNTPDKISQYANLVARGINDLSNNEIKQTSGIAICLTAPISQDSCLSSSQIRKISIQQDKISPSTIFCKPKLVRPVELDTFIPSIPQLPKLESISIVNEKNEKPDSIANIIKKFNNLNNSSSILKSSINKDNNNDLLLSEIKKEQQECLPKSILHDLIQSKKDQSNISSLLSKTNINTTSSPHVQFEPSIITYELDDIPYQSSPSSSGSSSSVSQDSTRSTTTTSSSNNEHNPLDNNTPEETTYTVETFYKATDNLSLNNQELVVIRENTTEEQFNLAQEKQHQDKYINHQIPPQNTFRINETKVSPLITPLRTYRNVTIKQTTPMSSVTETQDKIYENYHSVKPLSHIINDFISDSHHDKDNPTTNDIVTINPHTYSPSSYCLVSSSSSSSSSSTTSSSSNTVSSASTVLLSSSSKITPLPASSSVIKTPTSTNNNLTKVNNKPISQLPKRTTTSTTITTPNVSRLKPPSKIVPSTSKLRPPSSTITKPIKSMIVNSTSAPTTTINTSSMRKSTGITNQSSSMANNIVNKTTQEQSSSSTLVTGKKQQLVNGTNMTESQNSADSSFSIGKNRVRSMVNQLNAAVSSSRPTIPSATSAKRTSIPSSSVNARRPVSLEPTTNSTISTNKTAITPLSRPSLQRAMTINNTPIIPSPPSIPPTTNNNISSTYKRKTPLIRSTSNVKEGLLRWCQAQVAGYSNVSVTNLSSSWSDGLAFCALTHHFFPDAFDFNSLSPANRKENFELAFHIAEERAGVPQLLDVSDMLLMGNTPDYKCIFTYLNSFLAKVKDIHPTTNHVEHH
ncbi:unnamed protein product [Rotaria sp. Silwood2]|nr:unnamed protein product [Rotaria sp. Silwood2]